MNPPRWRRRVATGGRVPAQKPYLGVLLHILIRFTPEREPFCPQSSKGRSDSFFDRREGYKGRSCAFQNGTLELQDRSRLARAVRIENLLRELETTAVRACVN